MTYTLWDKTSSIYDITAEQAVKNNPLYGSENSYLFYRDDGSIYDILPISIIRKLTESDDSKPDSEVCEAYIIKLTTPDPTKEDEINLLKNNVASLIESNQMLQDCIIDMIIKNDLDVPSVIKS